MTKEEEEKIRESERIHLYKSGEMLSKLGITLFIEKMNEAFLHLRLPLEVNLTNDKYQYTDLKGNPKEKHIRLDEYLRGRDDLEPWI